MSDYPPFWRAWSRSPDRRPSDGAGALVIGGNYRGLGVVRSLGRRGIPVWVLTDEHLIAATSRYARRSVPWPALGEAGQVGYLLDLGARRRLDGWAIFPTGDEDAALLARNHAALAERFLLTTPPWKVLRWAYDKRLTYRLAAELGVAYPWTRHPCGREEAAALDCAYPVILKPAFKESVNSFTRDKAWLAEGREALLARYDEACGLAPPDVIMVQELIPGGGEAQFSYAALCVDGRPRASLTARRTRQHPVDFGRSSSYVETVDLPDIEEPSRRLLAAMRYTGLVEVEFKYDSRDGRYKLLDINPRVWGWHSLGRRAGVDFPYLLWQALRDGPAPEVRARPGVRWVRAVTDLPAVAHEIWRGRMSLRDYFRSLRGPLECAIFALDDPLPALLEAPLLSYIAWRRRSVLKNAARPLHTGEKRREIRVAG
jgi:predicted ATP-grasp superfamily ATP-dependent carboligase